MKLFWATIILVAAVCAKPSAVRPSISIGGRITHGIKATAGENPYQISYQYNLTGTWTHMCGGSIISATAVITAGHCILPIRVGSNGTKIVAGILNLDDTTANRQEIYVVERIVHPNFSGGVGPNDVAILKLERAVVQTPNVAPIRLPKPRIIASGQAVLSGWGSTSINSIPIMPKDLQELKVPILPNAECKSALGKLLFHQWNPFDFDSNICSGPLTGGFSACFGDSGGPLTQNGTIYGIVSWGIVPCGTVGAPTVYTKVANFLGFIRQHVQDLPY